MDLSSVDYEDLDLISTTINSNSINMYLLDPVTEYAVRIVYFLDLTLEVHGYGAMLAKIEDFNPHSFTDEEGKYLEMTKGFSTGFVDILHTFATIVRQVQDVNYIFDNKLRDFNYG